MLKLGRRSNWNGGYRISLAKRLGRVTLASEESDLFGLDGKSSKVQRRAGIVEVFFVEVDIDNIGQCKFLFPCRDILQKLLRKPFWVGDSRRSREQTAYNWICLEL